MPEIIIRYLTIVINHFRARWRITFRVHVIIPSKFRIALVVTLLEMFFFASVPSSSSLFLSFSFFRFRSKRIACCLRVVGSIRSLKRGHVFEGMWFALFEGIFLFNNNYIGSGFQAEWFFIPVFILFFYRFFLFSFLLALLRDTRSSIGELQKRKSWEIQSWIGG